MDPSAPPLLNEAARRRAQRAALRANLFLMVVQQITVGGIMILFATDVLGFPASVIALLLAAQPGAEILRIPLLGFVERLGTRRSFTISFIVRLGVLIFLLAWPFDQLGLPLFAALLLLTMAVWTIFSATAWGVAMLHITTQEDRGSFFGRMRASFQYMQVVCTIAIACWVGASVTAFEYKILLVVAAVLVVQRQFYDHQLPDVRVSQPTRSVEKLSLWQLLRRSRLFGPPLWVCILVVVTQTPAFILYLRQGLLFPSNLVTAYLVLVALGGAVTLVLWGKLADAIGYRPFLLGLQVLSLLGIPLLFFIHPFTALTDGWANILPNQGMSLLVLGVYGLLSGAFAAGVMIGQTSLLLSHIERHEAFRLQGLLTTIVSVIMAGVTIALGHLINIVAQTSPPTGASQPFWHIDPFKAWYAALFTVVNGAVILLLLRIPNMRPEFSMTAFFTALFVQPTRHLHLRTQVNARDEQARLATARWFGRRPHPLALDPLITFLDDPSYDVRVEAIRSVAVTGSRAAGARLLIMLEDPEEVHFWDHIAWALGELGYQEAAPVLVRHLTNSELPDRPRAMSAGALAALGANEHAPAIERAMQDPRAGSFLRTASCRALLRIGEAQAASTIYRVLDEAGLFVERLELVTLVCRRLGLDTAWLLDRRHGERMPDMLARWASDQEPGIGTQAREIIRQLNEDSEALHTHFLQRTKNQTGPWLTPLRNDVAAGKAHGALRMVEAAWLVTETN